MSSELHLSYLSSEKQTSFVVYSKGVERAFFYTQVGNCNTQQISEGNTDPFSFSKAEDRHTVRATWDERVTIVL